MSADEKVNRDRELVRFRLSGASWKQVSEKFEITERQGRNILEDYKLRSKPVLRDADPAEMVWESVERYEGMYETLGQTALAADNDRSRIAAVNGMMTALSKRDELLQASGILPRNLGRLKIDHDVRFIVQSVIKVLNDDGVPETTQRRLLELLRTAQA